MISTIWNNYKGKKVRLIIKDNNLVRPRDGIFIDIDDKHIFLQSDKDKIPKPYLREDVKRVELKEDNGTD